MNFNWYISISYNSFCLCGALGETGVKQIGIYIHCCDPEQDCSAQALYYELYETRCYMGVVYLLRLQIGWSCGIMLSNKLYNMLDNIVPQIHPIWSLSALTNMR